MLKRSIKSLLDKLIPVDRDTVIEGIYADQQPPQAQMLIRAQYRRRWVENRPNPGTNPELYDPIDPPEGWHYDPYYECWIHTGQAR